MDTGIEPIISESPAKALLLSYSHPKKLLKYLNYLVLHVTQIWKKIFKYPIRILRVSETMQQQHLKWH